MEEILRTVFKDQINDHSILLIERSEIHELFSQADEYFNSRFDFNKNDINVEGVESKLDGSLFSFENPNNVLLFINNIEIVKEYFKTLDESSKKIFNYYLLILTTFINNKELINLIFEHFFESIDKEFLKYSMSYIFVNQKFNHTLNSEVHSIELSYFNFMRFLRKDDIMFKYEIYHNLKKIIMFEADKGGEGGELDFMEID